MVFFYKIRGGPCKGDLNHITLRTEDIVCYVGRDKHENEGTMQLNDLTELLFGISSKHSNSLTHIAF